MKIAIIGGGPAGMIIAATLIEQGFPGENIFIFDKNSSFGSKLLLTGGGRCNLTTGIKNRKELLSKYIRGNEFVDYALNYFPPKKTCEWFENHGVKLKTENDLRVFPTSDNSKDILGVFENIFRKYGVNFKYSESIISVKKENGLFKVTSSKNQYYEFNVLVIATGGDIGKQQITGYDLSKSLGHSVTPLAPSLNSLIVQEKWVNELSGISLNNIEFKISNLKFQINSVFGPLLFTHFGISGPVTFALSAYLAYEEISENNPIQISLIPFKNETFETWNTKLLKSIELNPKKQIKNILSEFMPERFVLVLLKISNIDGNKLGSNFSKEERKKIIHLLIGNLKLTIIGRKPGEEFVIAGGICLDEINNKTMESKICSNLYFAGEVLDIDALTGGFNLQGCWSTGRLAGESIIKK